MRSLLFAVPALVLSVSAFAQQIYKAEAFSKFGQVSPPENFQNYPFVNPDAPHYGKEVSGVIGGFNTLNSFFIDGDEEASLRGIYETLLTGDAMRPDVSYGLLAQSLEWPEDYSWVIFNLRPEAHFSDGERLDADDVVFSFEALKERGPAVYITGYAKIAKIEKLGPLKVKITPAPGEANADFIEYVGTRPIIPQHWWEERDFNQSFMDIPLGSGPYILKDFEPNRFAQWHYDPDYWGQTLPVNKGIKNIAIYRSEYYADQGVMRQAVKAGNIDVFAENQSKSWHKDYNDVTAIKEGMLMKEELETGEPQSLQFLAFNLNRPQLKDHRVRRALNLLLNFEYLNKQVFFNAYHRSLSLFPSSPTNAARGLPQGRELEILEAVRGDLVPEVFTQEWTLPVTDGSLNNREQLKEALMLFSEAGWTIDEGGKMQKGGMPFNLEILYHSETMDKVFLPYKQSLERLGLNVTLARIDTTSYMSRLTERNFDAASFAWANGFFPSFEQRFRWHSENADKPRSWNLFGYKNPGVDKIIEGLIAAQTKEELHAHARALDRAVKWDFPVVFFWHYGKARTLYWNKYQKPAQKPPYGTGMETWWLDPKLEAKVDAYLNN